MEERNPMEEQVEKEENSNQPESRMGKHNKRKVTVNTNGLFKIVITLLLCFPILDSGWLLFS